MICCNANLARRGFGLKMKGHRRWQGTTQNFHPFHHIVCIDPVFVYRDLIQDTCGTS